MLILILKPQFLITLLFYVFISIPTATDYRVSPYDWQGMREELFESTSTTMLDEGDCDSSRKSVMALAVTCALLLVIYVCTVFCLCTSKKMSALEVSFAVL